MHDGKPESLAIWHPNDSVVADHDLVEQGDTVFRPWQTALPLLAGHACGNEFESSHRRIPVATDSKVRSTKRKPIPPCRIASGVARATSRCYSAGS